MVTSDAKPIHQDVSARRKMLGYCGVVIFNQYTPETLIFPALVLDIHGREQRWSDSPSQSKIYFNLIRKTKNKTIRITQANNLETSNTDFWICLSTGCFRREVFRPYLTKASKSLSWRSFSPPIKYLYSTREVALLGIPFQ